jgi:hypothetical protein
MAMACSPRPFRRFCATLMNSAGCLMAMASIAAAEPAISNRGAILSHLPDHGSKAYAELFDAAGKPEGEALDMTKAEMWRVPVERWPSFTATAERLGVGVAQLDATWNNALTPMAATATMTNSQNDMMHDAMASKASMGMSMMALPDASALEYALSNGMHDTNGTTQPLLMIPLSDAKTVAARRSSISKTKDGGYAWHGTIEETGEPVTLLWWPQGRMTGTATYRGHIYAIRNFGGGMQGVIEMKPDALPEEHAPMDATMRAQMPGEMDPLVSKGDASTLKSDTKPHRSDTRNLEDAGPDRIALAITPPKLTPVTPADNSAARPPVTIRVIVAYTAAAARRYADIETDLIALAIEETNQSFRNSGIGNVQLELAYAYQTPYVESGTHFEHVFRFADKNDGYMDEVHDLRAQYKANVGLLIVHDPNGCGLAAEVYARPERAFAVVHHECAANMYSLAHEIGHLIGARHDEALDDSKEPFSFGHGYVHGNEWRTMMSYKDSCGGCPRVPVWSNPDVLVQGVPAGDATSNNAKVIEDNAARVAGFR